MRKTARRKGEKEAKTEEGCNSPTKERRKRRSESPTREGRKRGEEKTSESLLKKEKKEKEKERLDVHPY